MWCPKCEAEKTRAVKTVNHGHYMLRIRFCEQCEYLYKTVEGCLVENAQKSQNSDHFIRMAEIAEDDADE